MATKQPKLRSLRMYLLKKTVKTYKDAIRDDVQCESFPLDTVAGVTGEIFIRPPYATPVDWASLVQSLTSKKLPKLRSTANACVVFITIDTHIVAVVFGTGRYLLKDTVYEADFGLLSALNSVNPDTLVSLDVTSFEDLVLHKRIQTSRSSSIGSFELDTRKERFRSLTGTAQDKNLAGRITGTEGGLGVSVRVTAQTIADKCKQCVAAYTSKTYQTHFPQYDDLSTVSDKKLIRELDDALVIRLNKKQLSAIHLSPPEPLSHDDFQGFSFTPKGPIYDWLEVDNYLSERPGAVIDIEALKAHRVCLRLDVDSAPHERWSVYRCLICELPKNGKLYVLWGGRWCQVAKSFADRVRDYVKGIPDSTVALLTPTNIKHEAPYLAHAAAQSVDFAVLDQKFVYYGRNGSKIEVCDIFTMECELIHAKRKVHGAMGYSHLFVQGRNSGEAFVRDESFREQARTHLNAIAKKFGSKIPKDRPKSEQFEVVFAPMGKPDPKARFVETLPFLSQVTLMLVTEDLRSLGLKVSIKEIDNGE